MKIEWEENDLRFIEDIKQGKHDINRLTFFTGPNPNNDQNFIIKFKVTDAVLANQFLFSIFYPHHKLVEKFGIDIIAIGHDFEQSFKDQMKEKLIKAVDNIIDELNLENKNE